MLTSSPAPMSAPVVVDRARRAPGARRPLLPRPDPRAATRAALVADFLAIASLDPTVEGLRAPAAPATFLVGDEAVEHVADFELLREGEAPQLVDVVEDAALRDHTLGAALVIADEVVAEDGRRLRIETAWTLRAEPRITTVRLALACRRTFVSAGDRVRILHHLDECGTGRLVDCAAVAIQASDGVAAVLALACAGLVAIDVRCPIVPEMPVRRRRLQAIDPFGF